MFICYYPAFVRDIQWVHGDCKRRRRGVTVPAVGRCLPGARASLRPSLNLLPGNLVQVLLDFMPSDDVSCSSLRRCGLLVGSAARS